MNARYYIDDLDLVKLDGLENPLGDVNEDGGVDLSDGLALFKMLAGTADMPAAGSQAYKNADVNEDGTVDLQDGLMLFQFLATGKPFQKATTV